MNVNISELPSAWTGHYDFAQWLVEELKPTVTVDLGVDYGYSLFALAMPEIGKVYGVDSFEPVGYYTQHTNNYQVVMNFKERYNFKHVEVIKGFFDQVAETWTQRIQILHIDGNHTFESVTDDWKNWYPFVDAGGIVLMHDVISFPEVGQYYNNIDIPKAYFPHSAGLGIASTDAALIDKISKTFNNCILGNIA